MQPDLFAPPAAAQTTTIPEVDLAAFRYSLAMAANWQTRAQLGASLGWTDRQVRDAAEALGAEVVRCQLGFKLSEHITREDLPAVKQAIDAFHSQATKMDAYALALSKRLHDLIG